MWPWYITSVCPAGWHQQRGICWYPCPALDGIRSKWIEAELSWAAFSTHFTKQHCERRSTQSPGDPQQNAKHVFVFKSTVFVVFSKQWDKIIDMFVVWGKRSIVEQTDPFDLIKREITGLGNQGVGVILLFWLLLWCNAINPSLTHGYTFLGSAWIIADSSSSFLQVQGGPSDSALDYLDSVVDKWDTQFFGNALLCEDQAIRCHQWFPACGLSSCHI